MSGPAELDIRANPNLAWLSVRSDGLRLISAPEHLALHYLSLDGLSEAVALEHFPNLEECRLNHGTFTHLNFRKSAKLRSVRLCCPKLESLDFSGSPSLSNVNISGESLEFLNLKNARSLGRLQVGESLVKDLDLSDNAELWEIKIQNSPLENIYPGSAQLSRLEFTNLSGCRLPLSRLRFWAALGEAENRKGYARLHDQEMVFFESLTLKIGEELDLSCEAEIDGALTIFKIYKDDGGQLEPEFYSEDGGVFIFRRPGFYRVGMSNPKVRSWGKGRSNEDNPYDDDYIDHQADVTVFTGNITVF